MYKPSSPYSSAVFEDMRISSTFLKHRLGVLGGQRKPVLFVGFFSGRAVFALQVVDLWQIDSNMFLAANFHLELRGRSHTVFCTPVVGNQEKFTCLYHC